MSRGRVLTTVGIYGAFGSLSWAATAAVGRSPWHLGVAIGGTRWVAVPLAAALGLLVGVAGVGLSRALVRNSRWGRELHTELRMGVSGLSPGSAAPLALAAALGEELFFRGALQSACVDHWGAAVGVAVAALAFGLVHVPWNRRLWSWTATALVMGFVFGGLYLWTGELIAPLAAHAVINHRNLRFILTHEPVGSGSALRIAPR